jgi:NAD/NADP transhydrogenase beta subunit
MTFMPQMVAILHSFVGIAATIVGFASFLKEVRILKDFLYLNINIKLYFYQ